MAATIRELTILGVGTSACTLILFGLLPYLLLPFSALSSLFAAPLNLVTKIYELDTRFCMASVVFEDHPLESYFHDVGEEDVLPGGSTDVLRELEERSHICDIPASTWLPAFLDKIYQTLEQTLSTESSQTFVERFKYTIISSSLLSTALPPTIASTRRPHSPFLPGAGGLHSRTPSSELRNTTTAQAPNRLYWSSIATLSIFGLGYHQVAVCLLAAVALCYHQSTLSSPDMTLCLDTLQDLVSASDVWEAVVQEAVTTLEKEERSVYRGPNDPSSPSSTLRVALHSSLLTTQTQSDNVRQLFSALTSPNEIAQISEMYAPPSPPMSTIALPDVHTPEHPRPFSLPGYSSRQRQTSPADKRSTWSGSYTALAQAGSPTVHLLKRREKRRSDLSALLQSTSAPVSPMQPLLDDVQEEEEIRQPNSFGAAALKLRRRSRQSLRKVPSLGNASRFTTLQTPRHPLSISSIQHALQSSLSAKRYASSHLLALRFGEEYDEGYWEDVQSLIGLMTSTLVDASTRLEEAMEEAEHLKLAESISPPSSPVLRHNRRRSLSLGDESSNTTILSLVSDEQGLSAKWNLGSTSSFAPMPSHLARFGAHVDAISSALVDAQSHLETCVKSLRDTTEFGLDEDAALAAYDRLRRDLGMAFRECERGKERLFDAVRPPPAETELPALNLDAGSDESDKHDDPRSDDELGHTVGRDATTILGFDDDVPEEEDPTDPFFTLPSSLAEQVYEADTSIPEPIFTRERSKLSREERIRLAKERRSNPPPPPQKRIDLDMWGPGEDVVAELKDVIWQVGMKRRRTLAGSPPPESIGIAL